MSIFWKGFTEKKGSALKTHQLILFWQPGNEEAHSEIRKIASRYPSVCLKLVNVKKEPSMLKKHAVVKTPTLMLLKHGREADRVQDSQRTIVEQLFRKAGV